MRLGNKQLGVIVIAVGIIVLFVTIQGYFRNNMAEVDKINTEIGTLESEVDRLEGLKAKSAEMDKDIQSAQNTINQSLKDFAIEFRSEDGILLMDEFENSTTFNVAISDASFTEAGASIDEAAARTSSTGEFSAATDIGSGYVMRTGVVTFQYTADSYDDIVSLIDYIYKNSEYTMVATSISMARNATDEEPEAVSGTITLDVYTLDNTAKPREYENADTGVALTGVDELLGAAEQ